MFILMHYVPFLSGLLTSGSRKVKDMERENLVGRHFGRLTVLEQSRGGSCLCRCDCGNTVTVQYSKLMSGHVKSCGCLSHKRRGRDITGMRSGKLVAIEPTSEKKNGSIVWKCRCDCGSIVYQPAFKIAGGFVKSCGCARGEKKIKDLTGQRFGKLVAIERLDEKYGNSYLWKCRCDCGNLVNVSASALISGNKKSCGCLKRSNGTYRFLDITGEKFGRLTAIEPTDRRIDGSVVWRCACDCGKETEVSCNNLVQGSVRSCGCLKTENEGPKKYLNYIDGTCVENLEFRGLRKDNTSGCTGVSAYRGKWRAVITFKGRTHLLGYFETYEEAVRARKEAESTMFDKFLDDYYKKHPDKKREGARVSAS